MHPARETPISRSSGVVHSGVSRCAFTPAGVLSGTAEGPTGETFLGEGTVLAGV